MLARSIILGGTVVTGLGIWTLVAHTTLPLTGNPSASVTSTVSNPNFGEDDTFLNQPALQQGQSAAQQLPRLRTRGS